MIKSTRATQESQVTYQVNDLQDNFLLPARVVLDAENSFESVVNVGIDCKLMGRRALAFVTGLPSQLSRGGIKAHCSDDMVAEIEAGNVRWKFNVAGDLVVDWNTNNDTITWN
jgi:hypothetical protein